MAIDIRQLTIGSHILANDVMASVDRLEIYKFLDGTKRPWGYFHGKVNGEYRECGSLLDTDNVQPIAITPELLAELGFVEERLSEWYNPSWTKEHSDRFVFFNKYLNGLWKLYCFKDGKDRGYCVCQYLHQAEAFLALHGIELIND